MKRKKFGHVRTGDGSITCYSDKYKETCHSMSGGFEEAFKKFVQPCNVKGGMRILDICFGLGYNSAAAIHSAQNLVIVGLEKDSGILEEIQKIKTPPYMRKAYEVVRLAAKNLSYKDDNVNIKVVVGDAVKTVNDLEEDSFDVVFLDPFSPPKNPELWTKEFFQNVKRVMKISGLLATYSCAKIVRQNFESAGFKVKDGPIVGRRSPSTIATV